MTTNPKYTVEVTFLGDESEAPEFWWRETYFHAARHIREKKKTSGKVFLYKEDGTVYRSTWELKKVE
jgi:hypothetical protein